MKNWYASMFACLSVLLLALMLSARTATSLPLDDDRSDVMDDKIEYVAKLMDMVGYPGNAQPAALDRLQSVAKRTRRPYRRSGGMSLCLWKVCPAAPWLLNNK